MRFAFNVQTDERHMSAIHRFEIPVVDFARAQEFYETVLNTKLYVNDMRETMGSMLGLFPHDGQVGGALARKPQYGYAPSMEGTPSTTPQNVIWMLCWHGLRMPVAKSCCRKRPCAKMLAADSWAGRGIATATKSDATRTSNTD